MFETIVHYFKAKGSALFFFFLSKTRIIKMQQLKKEEREGA